MNDRVRVWDLPVRLFHWLLVVAFFTAYFTEEDYLSLHVWAGYGVIGLLVFRVVWGFIGSPYARFANFVCYPAQSFRYLIDVTAGKARRYLGHNPAGALMIILLLLSLIVTTATGLAVYGAEEHAGPLAGVITQNEEFWEEAHEFFANFTVLLVFVHLTGVLFESWKHRENLIKSMITGDKFQTIPDPSKTETREHRI
ncbi:MAG: cytochrome b/b6 domain-containing protein [Gammaproteobacteria bacterium]